VPLLLDLSPLRVNAAYWRLYTGFTLSNVGSQLATVAIGLQVYDLTRSTAAVAAVGGILAMFFSGRLGHVRRQG
jgi:hypothetical protein